MSIEKTTDLIEWTPEIGETELYFDGPSGNGVISIGDDSAAQFKKLGMGSALYFGPNMKVSFTIKKIGSGASYFHPTFLPKCYVDRFGRIYLQGTGTIGGTSITAKMYLSGKPDGECMYVVLELTNNSGSPINICPTIILADFNLRNFRGDVVGQQGDNDTDAIVYDGTNKYLKITTPEISNIFLGVKACYTLQHYRVANAFVDINADSLTAGDLTDAIGSTDDQNYIWVEMGEAANPITLGAGATGQYVFAIGYKTTLGALQTLMASLTAAPTTDLAAIETHHTENKLEAVVNDDDVEHLFDITMRRTNIQAYSQTINGYKNNPAGSYIFTFPFARDGYYSAKSILQIENGQDVLEDEIALFFSRENVDHSQEHEIAQYVNNGGRYITSSNNGAPGDQDAYQILKAYEFYVATQDSSWLTANIAALNLIADYLLTYFAAHTSSDGLFAGHGNSTYLDGNGNVTGENPMVDPVLVSLIAYALRRLSELNTVKNNTAKATEYSDFADSQINSFAELWNDSADWPYMNKKVDGTLYDNKHLAKVDAALWGILDEEKAAIMATQIVDTTDWWDDTNKFFREVPTDDALYSANSYWYGKGWNLTDFKALETVFRFGTALQAQTAYMYLQEIADKRIDLVRGMLAEHHNDSGVFGFSVGAFQEMMVRGLFGIDAHAEYFTINPNTHKLDQVNDFTLTNLKMAGTLHTVTVRGTGEVKNVFVNGVLQNDDQIPYTDNMTILVEFTNEFLYKKNLSRGTLKTAIIDTSDEIILEAGHTLPTVQKKFRATIRNKTSYPDPADDHSLEIMDLIYSGTGDTYNVVTRGLEGTIAQSHTDGTAVEILITAGQIQEIENSVLGMLDQFNSLGVLGLAYGGTGLDAIGSANQMLGVNNAGTGLEYKTITAGAGITITHAEGSITIAASSAASGTDTQLIFNDAGSYAGDSGLTFNKTTDALTVGGAVGAKNLIATVGTITADLQALGATITWNNAAVTFTGMKLNVTDTASNANSILLNLQVGGATKFQVRKDGKVFIPNDTQIEFAIGSSGGASTIKAGSDGTFILETGTGRDMKIRAGDSSGVQFFGLTDLSFNYVWKSDSLGNVTQKGQTNFLGSSSGTTVLKPAAVASGTLTLPAATDTLVGKATTDTLTNKTIDGASNTLTVRLANDVTGTLPVLNGGTGQTTYTNGQLLIGNTTGNTLTKATLTGTTDQVVVTNGTGSITLSLPQSINTTSAPQFATIGLGIGSAAAVMIKASLGSAMQLIQASQGSSETSGVNLIDVASTWNNAANTPSLIKFNITDTASTANALLLDLNVSSVNKFKVRKDGKVFIVNNVPIEFAAGSAGGATGLKTGTDGTFLFDTGTSCNVKFKGGDASGVNTWGFCDTSFNYVWQSDTLGNVTQSGNLTLASGKNIIVNATTGTKIGTGNTQKLGFWNATPIVQPATGGAAATFVANTSAIANDTATWDGYTIGGVVKALRNMGLLA